jgi:hypothetical protein
MGKLDRERRAGRRDRPCGLQRTPERCLVGVGIDAEAFVGDPAGPLNRGGLHHHHAGARERKLHEVLKMPVGGAAVLG